MFWRFKTKNDSYQPFSVSIQTIRNMILPNFAFDLERAECIV